MKTIESRGKSNAKLKGSEEIGVNDYIETIGTNRKQKSVPEEFAEDEVLSIVNHKRRWKKTHPKREQRDKKKKRMDDTSLRLN